jgi:hypothetical protein
LRLPKEFSLEVKMKKLPWLVLLVVFLMACGLSAPAVPAAIVPSDTPQPLPTQTEIATQPPAASITPLPTETETAPAATIPPLLTSIPGIAATLTAVASTPGAVNTLEAQQTKEAATLGAVIQGLSSSLTQCPNPSDPPMKNWLDIPVMPQATGGQVVELIIGSYYCFRAPVTVEEMESFYKDKLTSQGWMMQADANGAMQFVRLGQAGAQLLFLKSGPGNKNDLIVAINVTIPLAIPTPKP